MCDACGWLLRWSCVGVRGCVFSVWRLFAGLGGSMSVSGLLFRVAGSEVRGVWCGEVGIVSEGLGMGCVRSLWVGLMGQEKVAVLFVGSL